MDESTDWLAVATQLLAVPPERLIASYADLPTDGAPSEDEEWDWSGGRTLSDEAMDPPPDAGKPTRTGTRIRAQRRPTEDS